MSVTFPSRNTFRSNKQPLKFQAIQLFPSGVFQESAPTSLTNDLVDLLEQFIRHDNMSSSHLPSPKSHCSSHSNRGVLGPQAGRQTPASEGVMTGAWHQQPTSGKPRRALGRELGYRPWYPEFVVT
jgi:hypothetical protein